MEKESLDKKLHAHKARLASIERAEEESHRIKRALLQSKEHLDVERLRSKDWLERFEQAVSKDTRGQMRLSELIDIHTYTTQEVERNFDEALLENKMSDSRLELMREETIEGQRKALREEKGKDA